MSSSMFLSNQRVFFSVDDIDDEAMVKIVRNGGEVGARMIYMRSLMGHHGYSGFYPPNTIPAEIVMQDLIKWERLLLAGCVEVWLMESLVSGLKIVSKGPEVQDA